MTEITVVITKNTKLQLHQFMQDINLRRLFPVYYGLQEVYTPSKSDLDLVYNLSTTSSMISGYASALYELYTGIKSIPPIGVDYSTPRESFENLTENSVKIYPNPAFDRVHYLSEEEIILIEVFDISNQRLLTKSFKDKSGYLDIASFPKGIYFIKLHSEKDIDLKKIIKI